MGFQPVTFHLGEFWYIEVDGKDVLHSTPTESLCGLRFEESVHVTDEEARYMTPCEACHLAAEVVG